MINLVIKIYYFVKCLVSVIGQSLFQRRKKAITFMSDETWERIGGAVELFFEDMKGLLVVGAFLLFFFDFLFLEGGLVGIIAIETFAALVRWKSILFFPLGIVVPVLFFTYSRWGLTVLGWVILGFIAELQLLFIMYHLLFGFSV